MLGIRTVQPINAQLLDPVSLLELPVSKAVVIRFSNHVLVITGPSGGDSMVTDL